MKYAAPFDPTGSLKVPDTSLHLRARARASPRRIIAPYYKPSRRFQREHLVVDRTPIHEIDAAFYLKLFPLPRETARRSCRFDSVKFGALSSFKKNDSFLPLSFLHLRE